MDRPEKVRQFADDKISLQFLLPSSSHHQSGPEQSLLSLLKDGKAKVKPNQDEWNVYKVNLIIIFTWPPTIQPQHII